MKLELVAVEHLGRRVHRAVEHEQLGLGRERRRQRLARQAPVGRLDPDELGDATAAPHDRQIAVVERLDQHHLVAGLDEPEQARGQRLGGTRGHHDLALPVDVEAVEAHVVRRYRLAQPGDAHHRRILVRAVLERVMRAPAHVVGAVAVGKALAEIDRAVRARQARHHLEHGRAIAAQDRIAGLHVSAPLLCVLTECRRP